jgi:Domain of unknown function (DUF4397)
MRPIRLHLAKRIGRLAALAAFAAALTGCQVISGTQQYTLVRFIDATPDTPAPGGLDVYQDSTVSLYNIGFGTPSSYIPIGPGTYTYSADITKTQQQLATVRGAFALGSQYTVLIGNVTADLQMTILKDQSTPAPSGQVSFRFLDQSTRTGPVDIYLLPSGATLTGISPIVSGIRFGNTPTYLDAPSGTYSIVIVPTGTIPSGATSPLYPGSLISYPGTAARTIVLIDQPLVTTPGLNIIPVDDYDPPTATN